MATIIFIVVALLVGAFGMWIVLRNNPTYLYPEEKAHNVLRKIEKVIDKKVN